MRINFTKMHGCANDYIYVNCLDGLNFNPNELAKVMSPRHFSVGADGLVCICASDVADAKMRMFNLDGSEGMMCGNAIRCVGKYLYDNGICRRDEITIETLSGIKTLKLEIHGSHAQQVTVEMGKASFEPADIPIAQGEAALKQELAVANQTWEFTAVSMGNPHCVIMTENIDALDLPKIGPEFENHPLFPERVNTEFIEKIDDTHLKMRVWERGSGETYACGTGACATVAACVKNGICEPNTKVEVGLIGGTLTIECSPEFDLKMTGPATKVYEGVFEYEC